MGLIRGFSVFTISSLLLLFLIIANFSLTISLSEKEDNQAVDFYWNKIFFFALFFSVLLAAFLFFFVEEKTNLPITIGFITIVSSLPSLLIKFTFSYFENILKPLATAFSGSYFAFGIFFSVGILLIAIGFGLKFIEIGFYLSKFFSKPEEKQTTKIKTKSGK